MISPSDVFAVANAIKEQVEAYQSNNALAVEIKNRCITVCTILKKDRKGGVTPEVRSVLVQVRSVLEECQELIAKFANSASLVNFLFAKSYSATFTDLHERLLRQINDLQLVWASDIDERIVDMELLLAHSNEIAKATITKFEHEAFEIVSHIRHLDELLNLNRTDQAQLLGNLKGFVAESMGKVLDELAQLKDQKENGQQQYRRVATNKLKKALESEASEMIDSKLVDINWDDFLGEGSFGQVYSAQYKGRGEVAVKLIPQDAASTDFFREIAALQRVAVSREVLRLVGWTKLVDEHFSSIAGGGVGVAKHFIVVITELCDRSLKKAIHDLSFDPPLSIWLNWLLQVAQGMAFLAEKGIYHRDLKPDNVLIKSDGNAVISDFGLAVTKTAIMQSTASRPDLRGGTAGFIAPEAMDGKVSEASDVYSFGVMTTYALHREFPWQDDRGHPLVGHQIEVRAKSSPPSKMPSVDLFPELPPSTVQLLNDCCSIEPAFRPHFVQLQFALYDSWRVLARPKHNSVTYTTSTTTAATTTVSNANVIDSRKSSIVDGIHSNTTVQPPLPLLGATSPLTITQPDGNSPGRSNQTASPSPAKSLSKGENGGEREEEGGTDDKKLARAIFELITVDYGYDKFSNETAIDIELQSIRATHQRAKADGSKTKLVERLQREIADLEHLQKEIAVLKEHWHERCLKEQQVTDLLKETGVDEKVATTYEDLNNKILELEKEFEALIKAGSKKLQMSRVEKELSFMRDVKAEADKIMGIAEKAPPVSNWKTKQHLTVDTTLNDPELVLSPAKPPLPLQQPQQPQPALSIQNPANMKAAVAAVTASISTGVAAASIAKAPAVVIPSLPANGLQVNSATLKDTGEIRAAAPAVVPANSTAHRHSSAAVSSNISMPANASNANNVKELASPTVPTAASSRSSLLASAQITPSNATVAAAMMLANTPHADQVAEVINPFHFDNKRYKQLRDSGGGACYSLCQLSEHTIATAHYEDHTVKIWDLNTTDDKSNGTCCTKAICCPSEVYSVLKLDEAHILAGLVNGSILKLNIAKAKIVGTWMGHNKDVKAMLMLPAEQNHMILSASGDRTLKIWQYYSTGHDGHCVATCTGHVGGVDCVALLVNGDQDPFAVKVVSGGGDKDLIIWDMSKKRDQYFPSMVLHGHDREVTCVLSLSEHRIVSGSKDQAIRIWSAVTGECTQIIRAHADIVSGLAAMSNDCLVSCSRDHTVKLWDLVTYQRYVPILQGHIYPATSVVMFEVRQGESEELQKVLISGCLNGSLRLWY